MISQEKDFPLLVAQLKLATTLLNVTPYARLQPGIQISLMNVVFDLLQNP